MQHTHMWTVGGHGGETQAFDDNERKAFAKVFGFHGGWGGHLHNIGLYTCSKPLAWALVCDLAVVRSCCIALARRVAPGSRHSQADAFKVGHFHLYACI
jgi:hypothetical protein